MSQDIIKEIAFLLNFVLLGVLITFVYDWFLILRRLIRHNIFWISVEDLIFWIGCAVSVFGMLYRLNNGIVRWFAVAGAAVGMLLYKKTISHFLIKIATKILSRVISIAGKIIAVLFKPVRFLAAKTGSGMKKAGKTGHKVGKYLKKKLTAYKKLLKIILCKQ